MATGWPADNSAATQMRKKKQRLAAKLASRPIV